MDKPKIISISKHVDAAVTFEHCWRPIDPRNKLPNGDLRGQATTICIMRPLCKGRRETYTGIAICNPLDISNIRTGEAIALGRAIEQATGEDQRTAYHMARRWFWEQDHAAEVAALNTPAEVSA